MDNNSENLLQNSFEPQDDGDEEKRAALQREQLCRRPSYKKILDELASESGATGNETKDAKLSLQTSMENVQTSQPAVITINNNVPHPQQVLAGPQTSNVSGGLFHAPVIVTSDVMSVLASTLTNSSNSGSPTVVALPQGSNAEQHPVQQPATTIMSFNNNNNNNANNNNNNQSDLQNLSATQVLSNVSLSNVSNVIQAPRTTLITAPYYNIHRPPSNQVVMTQGISNHQTPQQLADEASKKREIRLMKNREAARHCRVKKKEYLKCLEERVQILEGQNKKLIDELKALKEFYTQHKNDYPDHKHNI